MDQRINITHGGIYLAKLNPAKLKEIGKVRPVAVLTSQMILNVNPPILFVCPLSSQSQPAFSYLHVQILPRDNMHAHSYALPEHCRSIAIERLNFPRLGQLESYEVNAILKRLLQICGI